MKIPFQEYHLFQILRRFENQNLPLDLFLSTYFRAHHALGSKDRQFIAETVYGMTKWRLLIDHLTEGHPSWEKRFATYKYFDPITYRPTSSVPLHIRYSCPEELWNQLVRDYGEERAIQLGLIFNTEAPLTIRINPLKTTREALLKKWEGCYEVSPCMHSHLGIFFKKRTALVSLPEFKEGLFEIQDEASQLVSFLVAAQPKEHVLDYCAGAGGKTLGFAPFLKNQGQIYLHDIRPHALEQARKRLKRAGIQNGQFGPPLSPLKNKMDWVLTDVPCSGTGTWRRNPDQKWKFSNEVLSRLIQQQREIFEQAVQYVRVGGKIVYATCSLLKEENEKQVEFFLSKYPLRATEKLFSSLPSEGGMDGFFAVVLEKF